MVANGSGVEGGSNDMDTRVANWLREAIRVATIVIPLVIYQERRFASVELRAALEDERDKTRDQRSAVHESRLDRLDASAAARLDVGADGGFGNPAVRGLINGTIREQTRHLATSAELTAEAIRLRAELRAEVATEVSRIRAELRGLLERIVALNGLKMPQ